MQIKKYWHKEELLYRDKGFLLNAWGGSTVSEDGARSEARKRLKKIQAYLLRKGQSSWKYDDYAHSEVREPLFTLQEDEAGKQIWAITRNRYGALVLNTAEVIFIDIDCHPPGCLFFLYKKKKEKQFIEIRETVKRLDIDCCIYETCNGFRLLVTSQSAPPADREVSRLMTEFKADKLYSTLCRKHDCYRARLTPKPFRIGAKIPVMTAMNIDTCESQDWIKSYEAKSGQYAICKLIQENENPPVNDLICEVKELHEKYCLGDKLKLA